MRVYSSPSFSETPRTFLKTSIRLASASSDSASNSGSVPGSPAAIFSAAATSAALVSGSHLLGVALLDRLGKALHQLAQLGRSPRPAAP